jgi:hypothetical protein
LGPFLGGILPSFLGSIFDPFFGQFSIADLLVLRDFLAFAGGLGPVFRWVFDRTFHRVFTLVRVAVLGALRVLVFILGVGLVQFVDQ